MSTQNFNRRQVLNIAQAVSMFNQILDRQSVFNAQLPLYIPNVKEDNRTWTQNIDSILWYLDSYDMTRSNFSEASIQAIQAIAAKKDMAVKKAVEAMQAA